MSDKDRLDSTTRLGRAMVNATRAQRVGEFRGFESENQRLADERAECEVLGYTIADQRESYEQWKRTLVHADKVHGLFTYGDVAARHEQDHRGGYNGAPWQHDVTDLFAYIEQEVSEDQYQRGLEQSERDLDNYLDSKEDSR